MTGGRLQGGRTTASVPATAPCGSAARMGSALGTCMAWRLPTALMACTWCDSSLVLHTQQFDEVVPNIMLPANNATWRCCELNTEERRSTCLLLDLCKHQITMCVRASCITPQATVSLTACLILLVCLTPAWSLQGGFLTPAECMWDDGCCHWQLAAISHSGASQDVNRSCLAVVSI